MVRRPRVFRTRKLLPALDTGASNSRTLSVCSILQFLAKSFFDFQSVPISRGWRPANASVLPFSSRACSLPQSRPPRELPETLPSPSTLARSFSNRPCLQCALLKAPGRSPQSSPFWLFAGAVPCLLIWVESPAKSSFIVCALFLSKV